MAERAAVLSSAASARPSGALRAFLASPPAAIGAVLVMLLVLAALLAPVLAPYEPLRLAGRPLAPPGARHLMGTDNLGRDVFTTVLYGMRVSLAVGFLASAIALLVGVAAGSVAGYFGGAIDNAIMRVTELFQVIPRIFLMIIAVALFGAHVEVTAIAIGMTSWPAAARILRAEFLSRRESDYVLAARVIGASDAHIIFREILPNAIAPMIEIATLNVAAQYMDGRCAPGWSLPDCWASPHRPRRRTHTRPSSKRARPCARRTAAVSQRRAPRPRSTATR